MAVASPPTPDAPRVSTATPPGSDTARAALHRFAVANRYPFVVWAWSRLLALAAVAMVSWVGRPHGSPDLVPSMIWRLHAWDGYWYLHVAQHWYDPVLAHGNAPAFFPLYPALIAAGHFLLPASKAVVGEAASTLMLLPALAMMYHLTRQRLGDVVARRAVLYLALSPLTFVFSAVYSESLALLVSVGAFLLLERRRYAAASLMGALAVLTRPVGILLWPALAWRMYVDHERRLSWRLAAKLAPTLLMPLALVGFQLWLWWRTGHPLATAAAEARGWGRHFNLLYVIGLPVAALHGLFIGYFLHNLSLALSAAAAGAYTWLLVYTWRRGALPFEYAIYAAGSLILPAVYGTWLGFPRYGLVVFPLFWGLALLGRDSRVDRAILTAMPAMMTGMVFVAYGAWTFTP